MIPPAGLSVFEMLLTMRSNAGDVEALKQSLRVAIDREAFLHKGFLDLSYETLCEETGGGRGGFLLRQDDLEHLMEALKKSSQVLRIDLSGHKIGDKGAKLLADYLENNTTLRALYIDGNRITDEGIVKLISALEKNKTLYALDLEQDLNMSMRKCNPHARFSQDIIRIEHIKQLSSTFDCPRYWKINTVMKRWAQGNSISDRYIMIINKCILENQRVRAEALLAKTRAGIKQVLKIENEYCISQLTQGTARGLVAGLVIGAVSVGVGFITLPVLIPTAIAGGLLGGAKTTYRLVMNENPYSSDYAEELDLTDWEFVKEEPPPLITSGESKKADPAELQVIGDKVLVNLPAKSETKSPRL